MRALFLDFDGVLHPTPLADADQPLRLLPHLERLLRGRADVGLVVHSTWRYVYRTKELAELLSTAGAPVLGATPRGPRHEAILWWLHLNSSLIADYVILDDDAREFPEPLPPELILCDPAHGILTPGVLDRLGRWLDGPLKP